MKALFSAATILLYILGMVMIIGGCIWMAYVPIFGAGTGIRPNWVGVGIVAVGALALWGGYQLNKKTRDPFWD